MFIYEHVFVLKFFLITWSYAKNKSDSWDYRNIYVFFKSIIQEVSYSNFITIHDNHSMLTELYYKNVFCVCFFPLPLILSTMS